MFIILIFLNFLGVEPLFENMEEKVHLLLIYAFADTLLI